jgi:hypothetical protein
MVLDKNFKVIPLLSFNHGTRLLIVDEINLSRHSICNTVRHNDENYSLNAETHREL